MKKIRIGIVFLCLTILCLAMSIAHSSEWTEVDLCTFPETGQPVPEWTILDDQWRPVGILFDVTPAFVNPIMREWGKCHLFFNPDHIVGVNAVFSFVKPGTSVSTNALGFKLDAWYHMGESAQLVGLDSTGNVVAQDQITPGDIGLGSLTLGMTIIGSFHTVEWRTQGDPGIAASVIEFMLPPDDHFPWAMFLSAITRSPTSPPTCSQIAGDWSGSWSEISCDGARYSGSWTSRIMEDCTFKGTDNWDHVSGTINPSTMILTSSGISKDGCGTIFMTGVISNNDAVSGNYTYSGGGGGSFKGWYEQN